MLPAPPPSPPGRPPARPPAAGRIPAVLLPRRCRMQAYWPFHKTQCRRNEFADMVEEQEPKFARWMRQHGKLAVLKDDEVDRLERAGAAASGAGRQVGARGRIQKSDCCQAARLEAEVFVLLGLGWQHSAPHAPATEQSVSQSIIPAASPYLPVPSMQEVMESMYGRAEPKPEAPAYTAEEKAAMRRAAEADKASARLALQRGGGPAYAAVELPPQLSLDCQRYKWRQSQSHVEVFVPLPEGLPGGGWQCASPPLPSVCASMRHRCWQGGCTARSRLKKAPGSFRMGCWKSACSSAAAEGHTRRARPMQVRRWLAGLSRVEAGARGPGAGTDSCTACCTNRCPQYEHAPPVPPGPHVCRHLLEGGGAGCGGP